MWTARNTKVHLLGFAVGAGIGAPFLLALAPDPSTSNASPIFGQATFAGGAIGGWLVGPAAWRAHDRVAWAKTIAGIAAVAVLVGDAVVVVGIGSGGSIGGYPRPSVRHVLADLVQLYVFGLVFAGWLYYVIALVAGAFWAGLMAWIRHMSRTKPVVAEADLE